MQRVFQDFVEGIRASKDLATLRSTTATGFEALGVARFAYFVRSDRNTVGGGLVSTYPQAWIDRYTSQRYKEIDPVFQRIGSCDTAFTWQGAPRHSTLALRQFFDEASQFGISAGFAIPFHEPSHPIAALTLVAGEPSRSFRRSVEVNRRTLQLMAVIVHLRARQLLRPDRVIAGVRLKQREFECLEWAARGKSAWETARILGVKRRTVSFHLDNAKHKFGVRTVCQAVVRLAAAL
ncbi:MAG: LuxR family transcriptional regulator [Alphaproteobacteria bacterium]|nr:LuxR family transcriptional regulator [Alphaproteobacteria bacterium]